MTETYKGSILIVDDIIENLMVLVEELPLAGYGVRVFSDGQSALASARYEPPDLVLLDVSMPGMNGFEVCEALKADPALVDIPVIFLSASGDTFDKLQGFEAGGVDYITKPFQFEEVLVRINTHLTIIQQKQELLRRSQQDIEYLEYLNELKDDLVRTARHDLRNPLTVFNLTLELLHDHGRLDDEKGQRYFQNLTDSTRYMQDLITNILDLAKLQVGDSLEIDNFPLDNLVKRVLNALFPLAEEKQIALNYHTQDPERYVWIDNQQIQQVLSNLIINALKYTPSRGEINIHLEYDETAFQIIISDNGLGIPSEQIPHIFDRFYRVNTSQHMEVQGTGLGLYIVKRIVDQHNGTIEVASEIGQGTTFTISIPQ